MTCWLSTENESSHCVLPVKYPPCPLQSLQRSVVWFFGFIGGEQTVGEETLSTDGGRHHSLSSQSRKHTINRLDTNNDIAEMLTVCRRECLSFIICFVRTVLVLRFSATSQTPAFCFVPSFLMISQRLL